MLLYDQAVFVCQCNHIQHKVFYYVKVAFFKGGEHITVRSCVCSGVSIRMYNIVYSIGECR